MKEAAPLERVTHANGVTLWQPKTPLVAPVAAAQPPQRIAFAFTERGGGVSQPPYDSLNLGTHVGDNPEAVAVNRHRALEALGAAAYEQALIVPNQVHGSHVVTVASSAPAAIEAAREEAAAGADALVVTAPGVPVLLNFADCVPVILVAPTGVAVVHSGWKGTLARVSATAAHALMAATGAAPGDLKCYVGPHILGREYEVSCELLQRFIDVFGSMVAIGASRLSLEAAITQTLLQEGVSPCNIVDPALSTVENPTRFFSYRASGGTCGRHGALACICP
jgi:YfiH family protein